MPDPTTLLVVDEADRLKMASLEQIRDIFDRGGMGLVLIGMPGIEKQLARYPQLYSRVGFVHEFHTLDKAETRRLLVEHWRPQQFPLSADALSDEEGIAAILQVTGGNFQLIPALNPNRARASDQQVAKGHSAGRGSGAGESCHRRGGIEIGVFA